MEHLYFLDVDVKGCGFSDAKPWFAGNGRSKDESLVAILGSWSPSPQPLSTVSYRRRTVGQNTQLLWEQADFDFTDGQYFVSVENTVVHARFLSDTTRRPMVTSKSVVRQYLIMGQAFKEPDSLSNSVVRSDQLLRETRGADN